MAEGGDPARAKARVYAAAGVAGLLVVALVVGIVAASSGGGGKSASASMSAEGATADTSGFASGPAPTAALAIGTGGQQDLLAAAKRAGCTFNTNADEGRTHLDPYVDFKYKANPPTSGNHTPTWAQDGAYATAEYETPYLVHSLEHGRIEYLWDPDKVSAAQLGSLKQLYDDDPYHLILHPNTTNMPYAIAAAAWDHSLTCKKMNSRVFAAFRLFKINWQDKAPEQIP